MKCDLAYLYALFRAKPQIFRISSFNILQNLLREDNYIIFFKINKIVSGASSFFSVRELNVAGYSYISEATR